MVEEVMNWAKLALKLQVSRVSLTAWRKLPEAPEVPDLERWQAFIEVMELGISSNRMSKSREELIKEKLTKENRLLEIKIAEAEKKMVSRAAVDALLLHVSTLAKATMYPALERELPPKVAGRTAEEVSLIGREMADRICEQMQRDITAWSEQ